MRVLVFGKVKIPALSLQTPQGQGRGTRPKGWATRLRKHIDRQFDFRYSVLPFVFGNLIRQGRLSEKELHGLAEDKLRFLRWQRQLRTSSYFSQIKLSLNGRIEAGRVPSSTATIT